jgi:small-conductance mechanosensitive channel
MHTAATDGNWLTDAHWLGNTPLSWIIAAAAGIVGFLLAEALLRWARARMRPRAERPGSTAARSVLAALNAIRGWLLVLLAIVIPLATLDFSATANYWLHIIAFLLVGVQLVLCINRIIVVWLLRSVHTGETTEVPVMLGILTWACQFVIWVTFLLALLTNAGVDITAFVASLGIGGIAVALALQTILGDLFASVAIGLDKPFEPGDFISFGTDQGTIKHVGVKTTRVQSLSGEQLAISNSQLLSQLTHNYSRMAERRVVFGFTVPYDTGRDELRQITERTNEIIRGTDQVRFDRGHFTGFGDSGFTFEFVYYVLDSDFVLYRDIQQNLNGQIIDLLDSLGVRFAVPARAVALGATDRQD